MANMLTLDDLIAALQTQKAAGVSGDTLVGIPDRDSNGRAGVVKLDVTLYPVSLAKDEVTKGWALCRTVTRSGIPVLVLG